MKFFHFLLTGIFIGSIIWALQHSSLVSAQSDQDGWTDRVNLSRSGGASNPAMVIDSNGRIHVIWQDAYKGTVYSRFDGVEWSTPVVLFSPFSLTQPGEQVLTGYEPVFVADPNGLVHVFWTDGENQLFHSYAPAVNFGDPGAWSGAALLAESALDFDASMDSQGRLHLVYVRNLESEGFPAGIYHRVTNDRGLSWSLPTLLYESPYFRALTDADANVDLAVDPSGESVYVVWDNQPRKQVYFNRSSDGGITWGQSQIIDSPTYDNPASRPLNIQTVGYNSDVLLFWQDGDPAVSCIQYFQASSDGGNTWRERQEMLDEISGCPQDIRFFIQNNLLLMMTTIQGQVYILAWDGNQWSKVQPQRELNGFLNPDTFDQIILDCRQAGQDSRGNLLVVGCDTGKGGDIWFTERSIDNVSEWFPPPSAWAEPETVTITDTPITNPIVLSDSKGRMHAFWIQRETTASTGVSTTNLRDAIYYSRRENDQWTRSTAVLQSPSGMTRQPAAAIDNNDNLYVVWSGGEGGEIYFSRASGDRANISSDWIQPLLLPSVRQLGSSPDIQVTDNGDIYVVYTIPLNEQRGLYLVISRDGGLTWTEPLLAFDAVQAGWDMIDQSQVDVSVKSINIIFTRTTLPYGSGVKGLYAVRSNDGGGSWSDVLPVVEKSIIWSGLTDAVGGNLFRAWIEPTIGGNFFQYQFSQDQGITWSPVSGISFTENISGYPAVVKDIAGQIYLVQGFKNDGGAVYLRHWRWDGNQWLLEEDIVHGLPPEIQGISVTVSPQGRLGLLDVGIRQETIDNHAFHYLFFLQRSIELSSILPTLQPEPVIEATSTPNVEIITLQTPTSESLMPKFPIVGEGSSNTSSNDSWVGLIVGILLAGLIAAFVFISQVIRIRQK